jgi:hypothetical protein
VTAYPDPSPAAPASVLDGDPRILIPLPEAADRLGISRWQAYKLARSGRLPTTRLGPPRPTCPGRGAAPHRAARPTTGGR